MSTELKFDDDPLAAFVEEEVKLSDWYPDELTLNSFLLHLVIGYLKECYTEFRANDYHVMPETIVVLVLQSLERPLSDSTILRNHYEMNALMFFTSHTMIKLLREYNMFDFRRIFHGVQSDLDADLDALTLFHGLVDHKSNTLVIIETTSSSVFGGFTCVAWSSIGYGVDELSLQTDDDNTFVFSLRNKKNMVNNARKFNIKSLDDYAVGHSGQFGPCFGDGDITINGDFETGSIEPNSFEIDHFSQLCDTQQFTIANVEVYQLQG